jgi:hypothetical protein
MSTELIWVADWEMQCCGEPFAVGAQVTWRLSPCGNGLLAPFLGEGAAQPAWYYDHHDDERSAAPAAQRGTVRTIRSVWCAHRRRGNVLVPVTGSAELRPTDHATGWEDDQTDDGLQFVGYLVELDLPDR